MISLYDYVYNINAARPGIVREEADQSAQDSADKELRAAIKWDMWEEPSVKVNWLKDNYSYNKIQFIYRDTDKGIEICFLMGFTENDSTDKLPSSWKMWVGKTGAVSYGEEWSWDLKTEDLKEAVMKSLDVIVGFIRAVEGDKRNYVAYYVHI